MKSIKRRVPWGFPAFMKSLGLLSLCIAMASAARTEDLVRLLNYPDTALRGMVTAETVSSVEKCRQLCEARTGCEGFDHVNATNACRMFASVNAARQISGSFAATRKTVAGYQSPSNPVSSELSNSSQSAWFHNGSWMTLRQSPGINGRVEIEIVYETPKVTLLKIGVRTGSTLFIGSLYEGNLSGKARLTSSRCGIIDYNVEGIFDPSSRVSFFLHGAAPKRGKDCSVEQWVETGDNANLEFSPR
jgi:hypothetical protein